MSDESGQELPPAGAGAEDRAPDRFGDYVRLYNNIDRILWTVPTVLLTITVVGLGIISQAADKATIRIAPLSHEQTLAAIFVLLAIIYGIGAYALYRIRTHHDVLGEKLMELEKPYKGYFHERQALRGQGWWWEDIRLFSAVFVLLSVLFLLVGAYNAFWPSAPGGPCL